MKRLHEVSMVLKITMAMLFVASAMGACWWAFFALKPYDISHREWTALYAHTQATASAPSVQLGVVETIKVGQTDLAPEKRSSWLMMESETGATR